LIDLTIVISRLAVLLIFGSVSFYVIFNLNMDSLSRDVAS